ncbi:hypothetical protein [Roseivirga pacifica]
MVDFVKVKFNDSGHLRKHNELNFQREYNEQTGEVKPFCVANYDGLKFILIDNGFLVLQGSLHKFFNGGGYNYNNFTLSDLILCLKFIKQAFGLDLSKGVIQNLEIGLNLRLELSSELILSSLLLHKAVLPEIRFKGSFRAFHHSEYSVKLYDKAKQHGLNESCFRVEIKYRKARAINELGIYSLKDLLTPEWTYKGRTEILKAWNSTLMFEPLNESEGVNLEWKNSNYWHSLTPIKRCRQKKKFTEWKERGYQIQPEISKAISEKWEGLRGK